MYHHVPDTSVSESTNINLPHHIVPIKLLAFVASPTRKSEMYFFFFPVFSAFGVLQVFFFTTSGSKI